MPGPVPTSFADRMVRGPLFHPEAQSQKYDPDGDYFDHVVARKRALTVFKALKK